MKNNTQTVEEMLIAWKAEQDKEMALGVKGFIEFDKSDPFTARRIAAHMKNGVSEFEVLRGKEFVKSFYSAKRVKGKDGKIEFRNVFRP